MQLRGVTKLFKLNRSFNRLAHVVLNKPYQRNKVGFLPTVAEIPYQDPSN